MSSVVHRQVGRGVFGSLRRSRRSIVVWDVDESSSVGDGLDRSHSSKRYLDHEEEAAIAEASSKTTGSSSGFYPDSSIRTVSTVDMDRDSLDSSTMAKFFRDETTTNMDEPECVLPPAKVEVLEPLDEASEHDCLIGECSVPESEAPATRSLSLSATGATLAKEQAPLRRVVTWGNLTFHQHEIILGDNPSVSSGPPLSIAWKEFESSTVAIDAYERSFLNLDSTTSSASSSSSQRRTKEQMVVPRHLREEWVRRSERYGASRAEMNQAVLAVNIVRKQRQQSARDHKRLAWLKGALLVCKTSPAAGAPKRRSISECDAA
jgi:hypothetical protein